MKNVVILLPIVLCFTAIAQNRSTSAPESQIYITHVTVIDTETGKEAPEKTVVITEGKISDISGANVAPPAGARIVDGRRKYLIPGLWDMHVHGTNYESTLPVYVANGVTGVREMFGPPDAKKFRADLARKNTLAPHIYMASQIIDGNPPIWPNSIKVETAEQARKAVDEQKQRGADFIKIYSRLSRDAYFAIMDEARKQHIEVQGHVPDRITAWEATEAKQKSIEHLLGMPYACSSREKELWLLSAKTQSMLEGDRVELDAFRSYSQEKCDRLLREFIRNGTWAVPTLSVYKTFGFLNDAELRSDTRMRYFGGEFRDWLGAKDDPRLKSWASADFELERELFKQEQRLVGELFRSGVPLLAGTDTGNPYCFPGFSLHDELALLVEAGLTPLAALQSATSNAAVFMNATDRYGSIARGKIADLVLLDADPLQDIHNTTKIRAVFVAGKEFDRAALDSILRVAEAAASHATNSALESQKSEEAQGLKMPGPDVQNLMLGSWVINVKYPPSSERPSGDTGVGTEVWRAGPGGRSIIEESREKNAKGDVEGLGVAWWDKQAQGQRFVWCENSNPDGCYVSTEVAKWNGERLEWKEEQDKRVYSEIFKDITGDSFTQVLQEGEPGEPLKDTAVISAKRKSQSSVSSGYETGMEAELQMPPNAPAEDELRKVMAERRKASIEGNVETIANSMLDEYVQTDIYGYRQDKTAWLNEYFKPLAELIKAGKFHWDVYELKNLEFLLLGESAVVTGALEARGSGAKLGLQHTWVADPKASFGGTLHFTHVYVRRNGKWMLAALHNQLPLPPTNGMK
jgi:Amidohydrolase family/Domain of unknown function (DUF4440)